MGKLNELNRLLDQRLLPREEREENAGEMQVQAVIEALMEIAEALPAGSDVSLGGIESAIKSLAGSFSVAVEAPVVNVKPALVEVAAPVVNVEAPNVEVLMPANEVVEFTIIRDDRGYMTKVIAGPHTQVPSAQNSTIEYE